MSASFQSPTAMPLGAATISGTQVTVDQMTKPATKIAPIIRNLVAANEGYFIEKVFATPGMTVEGGAVIYEENFPANHFLDPDAGLAPRAPGSEAPRIAALRGQPSVARPESWSGSIEVTDEARRRNDVIEVRRVFNNAANSFADLLQTRGMAVLADFVTASGRTQPAAAPWDDIDTSGGLPNIDPSTLPGADFSQAINTFIADKAGMRPNIGIVHQDAAFYLDLIYPNGALDLLLKRLNIQLLVSPQQTRENMLLLKQGQVGAMMFEKPLGTEYTREGTRFTDVYTLEAVPVFLANDASALLEISGVLNEEA